MLIDLQALPETVGDLLYTTTDIGGLIISAVGILAYTIILLIIFGKANIKVKNISIIMPILYYPLLGVLIFLGWLPTWTIIFLTFILIILISREKKLLEG